MKNIDSHKWEKLKFESEGPSPRRWHSLTKMIEKNGQFLVFGGYNGNLNVPLKDFYMLDLGNNLRKFLKYKKNLFILKLL